MSQEYKGEDRRGWHVKKEIGIGDLIAFASAALAVIYAYTTLDARIKLLEAAAVNQATTDSRQDSDSVRYQGRIDETLREMNRKLDRLIERR
jgi:hypothetical protein